MRNLRRYLFAGALSSSLSVAQAVDVGDIADEYRDNPPAEKGLILAPTARNQSLEDIFQTMVASGEIHTLLGQTKSMGDPRLGTRLKHLVAATRSKSGQPLQEIAKGLNIELGEQNLVELEIYLPDGEITSLQQRVQSVGGSLVALPEQQTVFAHIPLNQLEAFLDQAPGNYFDVTRPFEPFFGGLTGEGVPMMDVEKLHKAGITGKGVTVAILDMGFQGHQELIAAGELPESLARISFDEQGQSRPLAQGVENVHGTGCAEIVADIAPAANQIWVEFSGNNSSLVAALNWLQTQDIDIVSASWGSHHDRIDGLALTDRLVDKFIAQQNILWVNAAGNEARNSWSGTTADHDGNGIADAMIKVKFDPRVPQGYWTKVPLQALVQWDDYRNSDKPLSDQDIDAAVFIQHNGKLVLWAKSQNVQNGKQWPKELLINQRGLPNGEAVIAFALKHVDRDMKIRVTTPREFNLLPASPAYSISSPATAKQALAVGAINAVDNYAGKQGLIAAYSSHGPTWDNRLKPEVSAPASVSSQVYQGPFSGTSAAAPHVAGFAALLQSTDPNLTGARLREAIVPSTRPLGNPQPNNAYGYGLVYAKNPPQSAPTPQPAPPQPVNPIPSTTRKAVEEVLDQLLGN